MAGVKNENGQAKRSDHKDLTRAKEKKEMQKVKMEQIRQSFEECRKEFGEDGELPFYQKTTGKGKDG